MYPSFIKDFPPKPSSSDYHLRWKKTAAEETTVKKSDAKEKNADKKEGKDKGKEKRRMDEEPLSTYVYQ